MDVAHLWFMSDIDDGWSLERAPTQTAATRELTERGRSRLELIREALRILDGDAPEEVELEGDGWSLLAPESVAGGAVAPAVEETPVSASVPAVEPEVAAVEPEVPAAMRPRPVSLGSLMVAVHDALDEALSEGWLLAGDEGPRDSMLLTSQEEAFFAAGDELAHTSPPVEGEYAEEPPRWKRILRKTA